MLEKLYNDKSAKVQESSGVVKVIYNNKEIRSIGVAVENYLRKLECLNIFEKKVKELGR